MAAHPPSAFASAAASRLLDAAEAEAAAGDRGNAERLLARALDHAPESVSLRPRAAGLLLRLARPAAAAELALATPVADAQVAAALAFLAAGLERANALFEAVAVLRHARRGGHLTALEPAFVTAAIPAFRRTINDGADLGLFREVAAAAAGALDRVVPANLREIVRLAESLGHAEFLRPLADAALAGLRCAGRVEPGDSLASAIEALLDAPPHSDRLVERGLLLRAHGRSLRAALAFEIAHLLDPQDGAARLNHGLALLSAGRVAEAAEIFSGCSPAAEPVMERVAWPAVGGRPWPFGPPPQEAGRSFAALLPEGAEWPLITLITPSFNQVAWLEETILSVRHQLYPRLQYIVVDGGSSDGSAAVIQRHGDAIETAIIEPDGGQAEALNKGLALACGDLVGWINSDDMLAPGALFMAAAAWLRDPGADIVHGFSLVHRDRGLTALQRPLWRHREFDVAALGDIFGRWMGGEFFLQPEVLFTRRLLLDLGGRVEEGLHWTFDYALWLEAARRRARVLSVPWPFALYRLHTGQKTVDRRGLVMEQVAVRDRLHRPAPSPARAAAIRARLGEALARRPVRLLLLDPRLGEATASGAVAEAVEALAAEGIALHCATDPGQGAVEADILLRIARAHDGPGWVEPLRRAGFGGPVVGWLAEDLRDPYANVDILRALDLILPSHLEAESYLASTGALLLPATPVAVAEVAGASAVRLFDARGDAAETAEPSRWAEAEMRFAARTRHKAALLRTGPGGGLPPDLFTALLAGQVPVVPDGAHGLDGAVPRELQARLPILRSTPGENAAAALRRAEDAFDAGGRAGAETRHHFALEGHTFAARLRQFLRRLREAADG